jgi:hypothetical protein
VVEGEEHLTAVQQEQVVQVAAGMGELLVPLLEKMEMQIQEVGVVLEVLPLEPHLVHLLTAVQAALA